MRQDWDERNPGLEIGLPAVDSPETEALGIDLWRSLPRAQTPPWPDLEEVARVTDVLSVVPSIVAPHEVDQLRERLAEVCEGRAFLLQGGDCAETFAGN